MSLKNKRARAARAGLRSWRNRITMDGALICGSPKIQEVVYGYRFPSHPGRIKIGYSSRGLARVAEQSTAFPEIPELVFVIHDPGARSLEVRFHEALAARQSNVMGTEWFDVTLEDLFRISPQLRHAAGRTRGHRIRRALGIALALLLGLLIYPPLAQAQMAMALQMPMHIVAQAWTIQMTLLSNMDAAGLWTNFRWTRAYAVEQEFSLLAQAIPGLLSLAPLAAVMALWRRQT